MGVVGERRSSDVGEVPIPKYVKPQMDHEDLKATFGAIMVASTLVGVATRGPYSGIMGAMTGAIDGFVKRDDQMVEQSMKVYDTSLKAIKEQNDQKRRAVEDAWKKYSNDLIGLKTEVELIAAKYDDPLALQAARSKSLSETQKLIDANVRSIDMAIQRLEGTRATISNAQARHAEANARILQSEERLQIAREKWDRAKQQGEAASARAVSIIDELQSLLQTSTGITGAAGMVRRPMESVKSMLGGDEGTSHKYESLARELQNILRQTEEFHYKGRTLSREVADRDVIVRGLKLGDTDEISSDQLNHLRNVLTGEGTGFQPPAGQPARAETKTLNGKTYTKINGQWYEQ